VDSSTIWLALACLLVIEGLFPFFSPSGWRRMFERLLIMSDGQIRFFGLGSILAGLLAIALLV
jgi:hypothetical protein